MSYQEVYKANYARIARESVIKSIVYGAVIGLGVAIVIALATMFIDFNGLWLALGGFAAVTVALSFVFYYVKFRPTQKYVAERFDRMGFDERFITMLELNGDESYIAQKQRENTIEVITAAAQKNNGAIAVRSAAEKLAAVGLTTRNIIIAAVVFSVAVVSVTFTALPNKKVRDLFHITPEYNIAFSAGEDGYLTCSANDYELDLDALNSFSQTVREGDPSATVVITPKYGLVFAGWTDSEELVNPSRNINDVRAALNAVARYEEMEEPEDIDFGNGEGDGMGEGGPGDPGENNPNAPPSENGNSGDSDFNPGHSGNGSPGDSVLNGNVLDGDTDYKEIFGEYYEEVMNALSSGKELPPALRQLYESYFKGLK